MTHLFKTKEEIQEWVKQGKTLEKTNLHRSLTDLAGCFMELDYFNQPLNHWYVSNVENMSDMFWNCVKFNQPLDS